MKSLQYLLTIASALSIVSAEESSPQGRLYGNSNIKLDILTQYLSLQTRVSVLILNAFSEAIEKYRIEYNRLPEGDNKALVALLTGEDANQQNRRRIKFLDLGGAPNKAINPKEQPEVFLSPEGEMLDGWGRPLVIRRNSDSIAVLSTGPNGILNQSAAESDSSSDDIYVKVSLAKLPEALKAEQPGATQPATQPADKSPVKEQPLTPTSKDSPR